PSRPLLPFPTRRSSDLADLFDISYAPSGSVLKYCLDRPDVDDSSAMQLSSNPPSSVVANFMHMPARIELRQDNPVLSRLEFSNGDRKSTRLNSSHEWIS